MNAPMRYAFVDESGTVGASSGSHFLVVAVLSASQPREVELPVRRALKKYGPSLTSGEIKAADFQEPAILRLLQAIAREEIAIIAVVVDQHAILRPPKKAESIYRQAVARAVYHLVERFPRVEICLDRRYTNARMRFLLEKRIRQVIEDLPQKIVLISQEESSSRKGLQAADAVAWAFFQKCERGDSRFYDAISSRVIAEEVVIEKDWSGYDKN
ncbi:DUF3800 domain-containing protein [bacterium]|nr:DUF3800 domain-containing protein [bacterium]OIO90864.1 MAG: hypothetical protein AUK02_00605 [Anaerolineae bacterium CG2_30_58_95]PJH75679.1 MAG: hypothetical protein CO064_05375 [Anaerolineae bacterium CG_4_9_14_0_8_um_filter_58_9]